ncbi:MAG: YqaJ viral recombinase family protein [Candidatus Anammoxibacter sp.]
MKYEILNPKDEAAWLELRKADITSTMSAALFGLSPYNTTFELYHAKVNGIELEFTANDRMEKGKRMEQFAAEEVALEHGFTDLRRMDEYIRIPELRIGSSFDFECICPERGLGLLEIKMVEYSQYKEKWEKDEAPEHIEVQVHHQLLTGGDKYKWAGIAAFYTIYDHALIIREHDREFEQGIIDAVAEFWENVDNKQEPKPDYARDLDMIKKLYEVKNPDYLDYTGNEHLEMLAGKYIRLKSEAKDIKSDIDATQAEIYDTLDNCKGGWMDGYRISVSEVAEKPASFITEDMVGNKINGRKASMRLTVKSN